MCDKFFDYFKENMSAMGFDSEVKLWGSVALGFKNVKVLIDLVEKYGHKVTVKEMIAAGKLSEQWALLGNMGVALVCGIVLGSLIVALQRCLCRGQTLADLVYQANLNSVFRSWIYESWLRFPGIYDNKRIERSSYASQAAVYA